MSAIAMNRYFFASLFALSVAIAPAALSQSAGSTSPAEPPAVAPKEKKAAKKPRSARAQEATDRASVRPMDAPLVAFPSSVSVGVGKVTLVKFPQPIKRVAIGDPIVADYVVLSSTEIYLLGKSVGSTNMLIWDANDRAREIAAEVDMDLAPLKQSLAANLPKETDIRLMVSSSSIVLNGMVSDTLAAEAAVGLAEAYAKNLNRYAAQGGARAAPGAGNVKVINLMKIRDPQQVMLEVRIAEVSKNLLERLGFRFSALAKVENAGAFIQVPGPSATSEIFSGSTPVYNSASTVTTLPTTPLTSTTTTQQTFTTFSDFSRTLTQTTGAPTFVADPSAPVTSYPNKILKMDPAAGAIEYLLSGRKGQLLNIDAQKTDELVKVLAEPTIVAISGKQGSFLSGGSIYVPLPVNAGESSKVQLVEFGIRLNFTPVVLDDGRINLQVSPEVSELLGTNPLLLGTRKVSSTVQMRDKETLVIGGLLKNNVRENMKALPILGEIPILGALFRSSEFVNDKSELVIVVSPSLVKAGVERPPLPTDNFIPPTRSEFFFGGKMEGSAPADNTETK